MHALSQLKLKKAYTVHILEKYIPLLQFTKCIMLRSLLKYVSKGWFWDTMYNLFKTLNFMNMNSPKSFHLTSVVMSDLTISKLYFRFARYGTDLAKYSCWKRCFINQIKVSEWLTYTFYDFLLVTSIWTYSM